MKKVPHLVLWVLLLSFLSQFHAVTACAYRGPTHRHIATEAVAWSSNPDLANQTYKDEILKGSVEADEKFYDSVLGVWKLWGITAPRDHFWNPDTDKTILGTVFTAYQKAGEYWYLAVAEYHKNRTLAYYYLGHAAHLLADMAVPAHVLLDLHFPVIDDDSYEVYAESYSNYSRYRSPGDKSLVRKTGSGQELFYSLAQQGQYFPSDDETGNRLGAEPEWIADWPSNPESIRVDANNIVCGAGSDDCHIKEEKLKEIADRLLPRAIEYTASLLNYFHDYVNDPTVTHGSFSSLGGVNRHTFTVATAGRYVIYTRGPVNTTGRFYDAAGRQVGGIYNGGGELENFRAELQINTPGTFYADISQDYPFTSGAYTLHIDGPGTGSVGDRDDHGMSAWNATPVTVGSVTPGTFELHGDRDFFRLNIATPGRYVMYTRGEANTTGTILDANSNQLGIFNIGGELENFRAELLVNMPGTYYLEISYDYPTAPGTTYTLHIDGPGAGSIGDRDDHGMSAWNATPVTVGSVTSGTFELHGDRDFFRFTADTPGRYVIYTRGAANTRGTILGATSNQIGIYNTGGELENFRAELMVNTPGVYYAEVSYDYPTPPGTSYTFHLEGPPDTIPDDFNFTPRNDVALMTQIVSDPVVVQGITAPAAVMVSGGSYSINGNAYTATPGTVSNGDSLRVLLVSASSYSTTTSATVTIGGKSSTFRATTAPAAYTLTVTLAGTGGGSVNGDVSCQSPGLCPPMPFSKGSTVSLFALADSSSTFTGWSGPCSTTSNECTFQVEGDAAVVATFTAAPKLLVSGTGYNSLAVAYQNAAPIATILAQEGELPDTLLYLENSKEIAFKGGYRAGFSTRSGIPTLLRGVLRIRSGKLVVERLAVR